MFLKIVSKCFAYSLLNSTRNFAVTKFCLSLSLELWFCNLDRDDCGKTLTEIFSRYLNLSFLYLFANLWCVISIGF